MTPPSGEPVRQRDACSESVDVHIDALPATENFSSLEERSLEQMIGEAMGAASVCWIPRPTGEFDSSAVSEICDKLIADIQEEQRRRSYGAQKRREFMHADGSLFCAGCGCEMTDVMMMKIRLATGETVCSTPCEDRVRAARANG